MSMDERALWLQTLRDDVDAADGWVDVEYDGREWAGHQHTPYTSTARVEAVEPTPDGVRVVMKLGTGGFPVMLRTRRAAVPIPDLHGRVNGGDVLKLEILTTNRGG